MLSISKISKIFELDGAPFQVLKDIDIEINPGEVVVVLGMSCWCKSTLLKIIAGLLAADSGQILLEGEAIFSPTPAIGIVFQNYTVFPWMSVSKNIEAGLSHSGTKKAERQIRAKEFLKLVGLSEFANAWPSTLSGGMQQRVSLARTYAMNPKVLLMDEPFGALDALTRRTMQKEFLRIHSAQKKATVFVTHDVDEAIAVGDRIIILSSRPAQIVAQFKNYKPDSNASTLTKEYFKIELKNKIATVFRTFEDIAVIMSGLTPDLSEDWNKAVYVDTVRKQIANDDDLAHSVFSSLNAWEEMPFSQRQYVSNLLVAVVRNNNTYRKKIFEFALEKINSEQDSTLKSHLIFTAFHAGGGISEEDENRLIPIIDWIEEHLHAFDSACAAYYGDNGQEATRKLEQRLADPIYSGAIPLYLFNMRSFPGHEEILSAILEKYSCDGRKTVRKAVEVINSLMAK